MSASCTRLPESQTSKCWNSQALCVQTFTLGCQSAQTCKLSNLASFETCKPSMFEFWDFSSFQTSASSCVLPSPSLGACRRAFRLSNLIPVQICKLQTFHSRNVQTFELKTHDSPSVSIQVPPQSGPSFDILSVPRGIQLSRRAQEGAEADRCRFPSKANLTLSVCSTAIAVDLQAEDF